MPVTRLAVSLAHATSLPQDLSTNLLIVLRWVHFVAGIIWVGLLYFFTLVNVPFLRELDPATRGKVIPKLMPRALWWFRWASVVTVIAGLWYWMVIVGSDRRNAGGSAGGTAYWSFFVLWTLAFILYMGVLMAPVPGLRKWPVLATITAVLIGAASYGFVALNTHGWESNRLLSIGLGGGMGWFMMFNVWGIVWRFQKKLIRWTAANASDGTPVPPQAAHLSELVLLAARTNAVLSLPMLFFMAAASHYPLFVQ
jgi:uncharacterized membrane protein